MRPYFFLAIFAILLTTGCDIVHTGVVTKDSEGNTYENIHVVFQPACTGSCLKDAGN